MKKRLFSLLLAVLLLVALIPAAHADGERPKLIYDLYGLLSESEADALQQKAAAISAAHDFNVYIVITGDYTEYADEDADSPARDLYDYNELGRGASRDGSLLLLGVDDKFMDAWAQGSDALNETALDSLTDGIVGKLDAEAWYDALSDYLDGTDALLGGGATRTEPAQATQTEAPAGSVTYVYDLYGLLDESERQGLQTRAESIAASYQFGTYIVVVGDYRDYSDRRNVEDAAEDIYRNNGLGYGEEKAGIMLLLSMAERDYDLCAYSSFGHYAFTDYGKERLAGEFLDDFRSNSWYTGFRDYLIGCESLLKRASEGNPLDVSGSGGSGSSSRGRYEPGTAIPIGLFVGVLAALIICLILRGKHKSVRKAVSAAAYTVPNSLQLAVIQDQFSHVTQTRVKVESDSRSGGGGTHISSGGFSHSSGKF